MEPCGDPFDTEPQPVISWPDHQQYEDVINSIAERVDQELAEAERWGEITHEEHEKLLRQWKEQYLSSNP